MKTYLRLFAILLIVELLLGMLGLFLTQEIVPKFAESIGHLLNVLLALPLSLINPTWPFYTSPTWFGLTLMVINIVIHTGILYAFMKLRRKKI
ncbi:hypothetical protein AM493_02100 [Flavobacterium akiainvivens]|uniref:Uncharacterized protein n=1 Tax=Flavobacterium akiainvivens TaxID=1202724 RepID=A0A0M8MB35_9FLAO|nr:hypothetical protein [Flavobacterium akiainvivens]KOS04964.1 hypothetical protein AM493_02100 [Flavobacterium akiainvivens]SFQ41375.1 hypothetical protein SAMN05444144_10499 [Flavobacterium akiainvivens]